MARVTIEDCLDTVDNRLFAMKVLKYSNRGNNHRGSNIEEEGNE